MKEKYLIIDEKTNKIMSDTCRRMALDLPNPLLLDTKEEALNKLPELQEIFKNDGVILKVIKFVDLK